MRRDLSYGPWQRGGAFIGNDRAIAYVTVDPEWRIHIFGGTAPGEYPKRPFRAFQNPGDSPAARGEVLIPHIKSIAWDKSIDSQSATCNITIYNQMMLTNTGKRPDGTYREPQRSGRQYSLGEPGYFGWDHGGSRSSRARFKHKQNEWFNLLVPNALIRTYEGYNEYAGEEPGETWNEQILDGEVTKTGTWFVDEVTASTSGFLELRCRDASKLLIEQICFPPVVPAVKDGYPIHRQRYYTKPGDARPPNVAGDRQARIAYPEEPSSGNDTVPGASTDAPGWNTAIHGHNALMAIDGSLDTYWLSAAQTTPNGGTEWIEFDSQENFDRVDLDCWGEQSGSYEIYVCIFESGAWQGTGTIPGLSGVTYVVKTAVDRNGTANINLDRVYLGHKVRIAFRNLGASQAGGYRAGLREIRLFLSADAGVAPVASPLDTPPPEIQEEGNYVDFTDIVKDFCNWGGFNYGFSGAETDVHGTLEYTGTYHKEALKADLFDKKPLMDCINVIREMVGFHFWIDEDGAVQFRMPNWYTAGNFWHDGGRTNFIMEVDDETQLTDYTVRFSDRNINSEIIIAARAPDKAGSFANIVTTRFVPSTASLMRGIEKPFAYMHPTLKDPKEQRIMAELIALHTFFRLRQGNVTVAGNPVLQLDDQIRISERTTGDTYLHYIRGISSQHDLDSGEWTMNITTHWLGESDDWVIRFGNAGAGGPYRFDVSEELETYLNEVQGRAVQVRR